MLPTPPSCIIADHQQSVTMSLLRRSRNERGFAQDYLVANFAWQDVHIFKFLIFVFGKKNLHDISHLPGANVCYDATMFRSVPIWHCLKFHYFIINKIPFEMFWNVLKVLRVTRFFFFREKAIFDYPFFGIISW